MYEDMCFILWNRTLPYKVTDFTKFNATKLILDIKPSNGGIPIDARWYIDKKVFLVDDYIGLNISKLPYTNKYNFIIEGSGKTVISQVPAFGERLIEGGSVILYTN